MMYYIQDCFFRRPRLSRCGLERRRTGFAGQFSISYAASSNPRENKGETVGIGQRIIFGCAIVVAEHLLIEVAEKMERFDAHVGSVQSALQEAPEILKAVSVDATVNVPYRVINDLMHILGIKADVGVHRVGIERSARLYVLANLCMNQRAAEIRQHGSADLSAPLQDSHNQRFASIGSVGNGPGAFALMHVAGFAADVSLIGFHFSAIAAHLHQRAVGHSLANPMHHEPCGFLSDAERTGNLARGNAILGSGDQPHCRKPFFKAQRRVFKDGPDFGRKLPFGVCALALPFPLSRQPSNVFPPAGRANHALGPAMGDHVLDAVVLIGEVDNGFLECLWAFHTSNHSRSDLICQVYICPKSRPGAPSLAQDQIVRSLADHGLEGSTTGWEFK
jgi:hypothetical protein